ncbi:uncharacterized protein MONBRDRAFT_27671 [Monosiga brevicollis MX1]|uniref:Septin-type G domain-containing protein n=1 Tax=Monosiga brevicollis TaxID=81824 RepID=A9V5Z3_MONBE|nr:uncharacterized protein MONBRDRAFT_27671 [Monosiga brevicollis MX1]EDQ86981.1 predicted protein [Monosiga brevicollis MX1]|eukprot:XP_001748220.1 hypothetical protein [Monosiga brevicollis MX1]
MAVALHLAEIGFVSLPNQIHQRVTEAGFDFSIMAVGQTGLGKSTLINSLFNSDIYIREDYPSATERQAQTMDVSSATVMLNEDGVEVRLTVIDTPGFGSAINNTGCWEAIEQYITQQFEAYEAAESALTRTEIPDTRVHCCLYFISPSVHGLRALDIHVLRRLQNKVNIIPVIAKADTLTDEECHLLKKRVLQTIEEENISIYRFPDESQNPLFADDPTIQQARSCLPFAICSSQQVVRSNNGQSVRGRTYPWGTAEVENPDHSEFTLLRDLVLRTYLQNLIDTTNDSHYEKFRAEHLSGISFSESMKRSSRMVLQSESNPLDAIKTHKAKHEHKLETKFAELYNSFLEKVAKREAAFADEETKLKRQKEALEMRLAQRRDEVEEKRRELEQQRQEFTQQQEAKGTLAKRRTGFRLH